MRRTDEFMKRFAKLERVPSFDESVLNPPRMVSWLASLASPNGGRVLDASVDNFLLCHLLSCKGFVVEGVSLSVEASERVPSATFHQEIPEGLFGTVYSCLDGLDVYERVPKLYSLLDVGGLLVLYCSVDSFDFYTLCDLLSQLFDDFKVFNPPMGKCSS